LEIKRFGLIGDGNEKEVDAETLRLKLAVPNAERIFYIGQAFESGMSVEEIFELTKIDRWFLRNVQQIVEEARRLGCTDRKSGFQPDSADGLLDRRNRAGQTGSLSSESVKLAEVQFRGFDERGTLEMKQGHLPPWEQAGATYFVTFWLADSVAKNILAAWREERAQWLKFHPPPWDWKTAREYTRRFEEEREQWLDQGQGSCLLRQPKAAQIVSEALRHFDRERYLLDAYVVMPNHVHVLVKPVGSHSIADILHSWKSFTANAINRELDREGTVWMREAFDTIVRDVAHLNACRDYIAQNPDKAALLPGQFILERRDILVANGQAGSLPAESGLKPDFQREPVLRAKKMGFSDRQLAIATAATENAIRSRRIAEKITPTYRLVDTCAAEFEAYTPYYYSTYGSENERRESGKRKIMILGGGPNRIGQGIEFDYCCVHAAFALRELGFETIMVNSNPETVSTDYDTSDKLYF